MINPGASVSGDTLSEDELFVSLVDSAFEFLNKAIEEFGESAKFSTIHFATAIELFLKARLMKEHWSLLVEKTEQADRTAFFKGKLKSVSSAQAVQRLRKIADVSIPEPSREIFEEIARHRNKMVHFIHEEVKGNETSIPEMTQIAAEQCAGWLALRLLLGQWGEWFEKWENEIHDVSHKMERYRAYLEEKFKSKAGEIASHTKTGGHVTICPSCHFESVLVSLPMGQISPASCILCWYSGAEVEIKCDNQECNEILQFSSYEGPPDHFPICGSVINEKFIVDALDTGPAITKDNLYDCVEKSCPYCGGYHTVLEHHDWFVCTQCFEISETIGICGHCSEGQLGGVPDHSALVGCDFCDGSAGKYLDD